MQVGSIRVSEFGITPHHSSNKNVTPWETHASQYVKKTSFLSTKMSQQLYQTSSYFHDNTIYTRFLAGYLRVLTSIYIYTKL